ncbi:uncharacterized protein LOC135211957 [Macrobrachium nipponense]|uniref:uncharacterized protein LOC135211957 n=1 Tax=Macrobrachium nipponense TaxID=159736 RepID=UPI0030C83B8B
MVIFRSFTMILKMTVQNEISRWEQDSINSSEKRSPITHHFSGILTSDAVSETGSSELSESRAPPSDSVPAPKLTHPKRLEVAIKIRRRKSDSSHEIEDVTSVVLKESWLPGTTLVYVTDGTVPSASLSKITDNVGLDFAVGIFEILPSNDGGWSSVESSNFRDRIQQIQKTSRYTTTVLFSDSFIFLKEIIIKAADDDLLVWPARLLVITRSPQMRLHSLRKPLSALNAMATVVVLLKGLSEVVTLVFVSRAMESGKELDKGKGTHIPSQQLGQGVLPRAKLTDGTNLQVTGLDFPPHVKVRNVASGERGEFSYSGPVIVLLDMLAGDMNFTYSIVQPPDMSTGIRFPNGTWNGMVAMLQRKEVDFGLGLFGFTYLRAQIIDFTNPLVVDYGAILGRRGGTSVDPWGFALPFTFSVWVGFFATFIFILTLVSIISSLRWESGSPSPKISPAMYIRNLLQQDVNVTPNCNWEKLMVGVWLLFLLVFIECYSTNLVSLLAVRYISEPFQSLRDMLHDHTVTSIWIANSAYMQHLSAVESGIFREIADIRDEAHETRTPFDLCINCE